MDKSWHITLEVFNGCGGGCPGCALTPQERRVNDLLLSNELLERGLNAIADYGRHVGAVMRPVLTFGDGLLINPDQFANIRDTYERLGLAFGTTATFASSADDIYEQNLSKLLDYDDDILDITIDPFRYRQNKNYASRIRFIVHNFGHLHLQILVSQAMMDHFNPSELGVMFAEELNHPVAVVFTPSEANMLKRQYRYPAVDALDFAKKFYGSHPIHKQFLAEDMSRLEHVHGEYQDFVRQAFHIGPDLSLYAQSYTPFGDIIFDQRNGGKSLGNLLNEEICDIVEKTAAKRLSVKSGIGMDDNDFDCQSCRYYDSCKFYGTALARKVYADSSPKINGVCYGIKQFN